MTPRSEAVPAHGVSAIAAMTSEDFAREIPRKWNALEGIVKAITGKVEDNELTPEEGYKLISCAVAETFDYNATHGNLLNVTPLEMFSILRQYLPAFGSR